MYNLHIFDKNKKSLFSLYYDLKREKIYEKFLKETIYDPNKTISMFKTNKRTTPLGLLGGSIKLTLDDCTDHYSSDSFYCKALSYQASYIDQIKIKLHHFRGGRI